MGHSDYANDNDGTDAPSPHDDEHLYSRRASAHTLYSTTASSGRSSPTFSRRGSAATNNPALSPPHAGARPLYERGVHSIHPYGNPRSTLPVLPGSRPGHDGPPAGVVGDQPPLLNYDGIIKHPSRYPYARSHHSHHHHPYAYPFPPPPSSSPSTTLAHNHDSNPNLRQHPPSPGHPYYTQKRHSFAALRTGSSSSSSRITMAAMAGPSGTNSPPLPLVRLPSIDHGLPPFPSDPGMILPIRRGSLTDPLLHAHNSSSSSSLAGPSGTSSYSLGHSLSPTSFKPSFPYSTSPYESGRSAQPQADRNTFAYPTPGSVNTPIAGATSASISPNKETLPLFTKTSKTLFPQQHGASSISPTGSDMPSLPPTTGSGSASILGTKRKLDPLSEGGSVNVGPGTAPVGDYFNPDAPSIGNTVRTSASSTSLNNGPTAAAPVPLPKRRASQPSIKTVAGEGEVVGLLPTPSTTVSAVNSGASGSATSSERRSSNDSSEAAANGATGATQGDPHAPPYAGSNYTTSSLPMSNVVVPEEGTRYANITPRQMAPLPHETQLEVETKPGYAFPPPQQRQMLDERMSSASEMHGQAPPLPSSSSSYYEIQPSYSGQHPASAAYGPASIQTRIPAQGPLPPELRSRASTIFGGPPARPMYAANGAPLNASGMAGGKMSPIDHLKLPPAPGGNPPMYSGSMAGVKDGGIPSRPGLAPQSSSQSQVTSTLPYARSPALKVSHKIAERKRRKEMKELFDELRDSIPSMSLNSTTTTIVNGVAVTVPNNNPPPPADVGGRGIKSSKWEVLAKAVEYIAKLQYENAELSNSVIELQRLNQAFQDELSLIKGGGAAPAGGAAAPSSFENTGDGMQAGSVAGSIGFSNDPQLYPHHQPHPLYPGGSASVNPSPSPVSVHSMPPLTHHPNSMPAAIGHHHSGSSQSPMPMHQSPLGPNQQQPHPPNATPGLYPISAPPHMASHSFFSPGPGGLSGGVNNDNTASQFSNPTQRQFAIHSQTHSRNVSLGSNSGLSAGNQGHFEHAGSAPPALQQHPHHQQSSLGQSNMQMYPSHHHQASGSFSGGTGDLGNGQYGQHAPRPGSIRSFNSNQSILSAHSQHSHHPSHSPASVHAGIQSVQQQQQQDGNATWGSSSPFQQQIQPPGSRNGTVPPGSAQGTPMMSPSNASY